MLASKDRARLGDALAASVELLQRGSKRQGVVDRGRTGIVVEVREYLAAALELFGQTLRPPGQRTLAVASVIAAARAVKPYVHKRAADRFVDLRTFLVVQAKRHAVTHQEVPSLRDIPRGMTELHHMTDASAARSLRQRLQERLEPLEIDREVGGQLIEHGTPVGIQAPRCERTSGRAVPRVPAAVSCVSGSGSLSPRRGSALARASATSRRSS